jgi:hypothetical protein
MQDPEPPMPLGNTGKEARPRSSSIEKRYWRCRNGQSRSIGQDAAHLDPLRCTVSQVRIVQGRDDSSGSVLIAPAIHRGGDT